MPQIYSKEKERGGGGLIYPRAPYKLLEILRSPKQNTSNFNDKLLHNNRVFSHFLDRKNGDQKSNSLNFVPNNQIVKLRGSSFGGQPIGSNHDASGNFGFLESTFDHNSSIDKSMDSINMNPVLT